jgi:predicted TIM-barrel fold metal-dependent hydrolase
MINGQKVFDADTHIHPSIEALAPYLGDSFKKRMPAIEQYLVGARSDQTTTPREDPERHHYALGLTPFRRVLGSAEAQAAPKDGHSRLHFGSYSGDKLPGVGVIDDAFDLRIADMDEEGTDVHMMVPDVGIGLSTLGDTEIEMGLIGAYHRLADDFIGRHKGRFMALLAVSGTNVEESAAEVKRWGASDWAAGVLPFAAQGRPLDHPDMEPIYAAAAEHNLPILHHSMTWVAPYFPGYRDMDDNRMLARLCSHPWGAMKFMGSMFGSGVLDRYPNLRVGILESGVGWLPFWLRRLEEQIDYVGFTADLQKKVNEYVADGRFFASIEMTEDEDMVKMVMDFIGDHVLMYASDYPHAECEFPDSPSRVMGWKSIPEPSMKKLMWDNAARFFGRK